MPRGGVYRKGKASAPYEFGVKASIVTNNRPAPGGSFVLHARALPIILMTVTPCGCHRPH